MCARTVCITSDQTNAYWLKPERESIDSHNLKPRIRLSCRYGWIQQGGWGWGILGLIFSAPGLEEISLAEAGTEAVRMWRSEWASVVCTKKWERTIHQETPMVLLDERSH